MKKYINKISVLFFGLALLSSCEKELMDYEGTDGLYFDVRRYPSHIDTKLWPHQYYSTVEFGNLLVDDVEMSLKIMATGNAKDYDRAFTVIANADSTTAVAGRDYKDLTENCVIKAGENSTTVSFSVHRTPEMYGDTLLLQLKIVENEMFNLPYTSFEDGPAIPYTPDANIMFSYNKDAGIHNIFMYDVLTRPNRWIGNDENGLGLWGRFSAKKYELIMEVTGTTIEDFQTEEKMPNARQTAIGETMARYVLEKAAAHEPVLDEDGTMMYFMAVGTLGGTAAWSPFTKPEDYYK